MVISSDWGSVTGVNKYKSYNDLVLSKCGKSKPFWAGPVVKWGVKYERANSAYLNEPKTYNTIDFDYKIRDVEVKEEEQKVDNTGIKISVIE